MSTLMSITGRCGNPGPGGGAGCGLGAGEAGDAGGSGAGAGCSGGVAGGVAGGSTGFGVGAGCGAGTGAGSGGAGAGATGSGAVALGALPPSTPRGAGPPVSGVGADAGGAGASAAEGRGRATVGAVPVVQWRAHASASELARSLGVGAGGRLGWTAGCSAGSGRDGEDVDVTALPPAKSAAPVTITAPTALRNVAFTRFPPREKSDRTHRAAAVRGAAVSGRS